MVHYFVRLIESELTQRGIVWGASLRLRPFIETHARELRDFVLNGVGLPRQFGPQALSPWTDIPCECCGLTCWTRAIRHRRCTTPLHLPFVGGMQRILAQIENPPPMPVRGADVWLGAGSGRLETISLARFRPKR